MKKIFSVENDLEKFQNDLKKYDEKIKEAKLCLKHKKKFNKFLVGAELTYVLLATILSITSIDVIFAVILCSYFFLNMLVTSVLGTISKNEDIIHKNSVRREVALANIDVISLKLEKLKKISNYKKENIIDIIDNNYVEEISLDNEKVKKLTLRKKPN